MTFKFLAIKNLVKRNKARTEGQKAIKDSEKQVSSTVNATSIGVVKDNPTFNTKNNEEVIKFPFIVLVSSTPENSVRFLFENLN